MKHTWSDIRSFLDHLVVQVYKEVLPFVAEGGDVLLGEGDSGDILAKIDHVAGETVRRELKASPEPCAVLDEAHGVMEAIHPNATVGYIVDEIDGTRPVRMKIPTSCICIAAFPLDDAPLLKNVKAGAQHTLTGERFSFERGQGIWRNGQKWTPPAGTSPLDKLRFIYEIAGGHQILTNWYLMPFAQSNRYGVGVVASSSYSCTRLLVGGIDFYIHLSKRLEREWPELREKIQKLHGGATGQYAWDLATTVPLMWEAGFIATRSDGASLEDVPIDNGSPDNVHDVLVARTPEVHELIKNTVAAQEQKLRAQKERLFELLELTT
jgi:fructose-1,6-bisphosphatase/inositol monophosphatase family enzyme